MHAWGTTVEPSARQTIGEGRHRESHVHSRCHQDQEGGGLCSGCSALLAYVYEVIPVKVHPQSRKGYNTRQRNDAKTGKKKRM